MQEQCPRTGTSEGLSGSKEAAAPVDPGALSALLKRRELQQLPRQPVHLPVCQPVCHSWRKKCKALMEHCQCYQTSFLFPPHVAIWRHGKNTDPHPQL